VVDLGTGDGRAAVARARREPAAFVVGLDASSSAMAEASLRAARPAPKGGLSNLLFAVASAEQPPDELRGQIDEITILFPWGSLLRGVLATDAAAAAGIASLVAPGGVVRILLSVTDMDAAAADLRPLAAGDADAIRRRWSPFGLAVTRFAPATADEIAASGSTWARRLLRGRGEADRPVWSLELRCSDGGARRSARSRHPV